MLYETFQKHNLHITDKYYVHTNAFKRHAIILIHVYDTIATIISAISIMCVHSAILQSNGHFGVDSHVQEV